LRSGRIRPTALPAPARSSPGTWTLGGHVYNIYRNPTANTVQYVPARYSDTFSGDLRPFFLDSVKRGFAASNWYLVDVEHGFEIQNPDVVGLGDSRFGVRVGTRLVGR
jgi:hypothetical protein